ncbi:hypothetical protein [Pseudovibrio sp. POLY-S9]|uniref:hypothetical protein n=1 Tax=Pseudovibrio sp. POLY-S9 TaxID=1576596 RepID=UPI000A52C0FE|nr:hypothetical protein [Pseudovibrio sp. POLY-S9]
MTIDPFFSLPQNSEWNAMIGKQGHALNYADGYIEAAVELADLIIEKELYSQRDTLVMPILYNARHAVELHLKLVTKTLFNAELVKTEHALNYDISSHFDHLSNTDNWRDDAIPDEALRIHLANLKPFIDSLSQIDEDGQELRYAENRDGQRSLEDHTLANIASIRESLGTLKEILDELKYRSFSLCDEDKTETRTNYLSRSDLFEISRFLPVKSEWGSDEFHEIKKRMMERFGIGSRQFSIAQKKIEEVPELRANIGQETDLLHLTDDKALFLVQQWQLIHPPRDRNDLGTNYLDMPWRKNLLEKQEVEEKVLDCILKELTDDQIADAETIFYLARNKYYSESYAEMLADKKKEYQVSDDIPHELRNLMHKTNFLHEFKKGVRSLGRISLADKLEALSLPATVG